MLFVLTDADVILTVLVLWQDLLEEASPGPEAAAIAKPTSTNSTKGTASSNKSASGASVDHSLKQVSHISRGVVVR